MNADDNETETETSQVPPGANANDFHSGEKANGQSLISVPQSPDDFAPPRATSIISEMAAMQRVPEHWARAVPLLNAIAGQTPSINGSANWDYARLIVDFQAEAERNGYTLLAKATLADISKAFKRAYTRNTEGQTVTMLQKQGSHLRLEYKHPQQAAE